LAYAGKTTIVKGKKKKRKKEKYRFSYRLIVMSLKKSLENKTEKQYRHNKKHSTVTSHNKNIFICLQKTLLVGKRQA
jgi:hypothetical protein